MSEIKVLLSDEDANSLRMFVYDLVLDEINHARYDAGISKEWWNSKREIKEAFNWGDDVLSLLIAKGLPVTQLGERTFHFNKEAVNKFLLENK
ncbi:MAG: hypothetical protein LBM95_06705 [Lactobacillales bacterium]|jgi:hypothetical protein|nr:hypothetical protein [Lactobacillales bacterium]